MQEDNFEKRRELRAYEFNQRKPYLVDSLDKLKGIVQELELVALNVGLGLRRVYEGESFSLRKGDEPARQEPFMVDRWALSADRRVRHAVTFVIRGESEEADSLRLWFERNQINKESSFPLEGNAEAYSFIVSPQVTVSDPLDVY